MKRTIMILELALVAYLPSAAQQSPNVTETRFLEFTDAIYEMGEEWSEIGCSRQADWSNSGFDRRPDEDERPWTVVRKGDRIGMIDNTGKVMIPIIFGLYQDVERMIFHMTPKGELAAARDPQTKKHGLIDRQGNWVIQPKYEELAWNGDENCFCYYTGKYDHGTFMGYNKAAIDLSR